MQSNNYCAFCAQPITKNQTQCPYEGLCFIGLVGKEITTIPKLGFSDPTIFEQKEERIMQAKRERLAAEKARRGRPDIKCVAYNIYGTEIATYNSFKAASEALNIDVSVINFNVNGRRKNGITECGHAFRLIGAEKRACRIVVRLENGKETGRWPTIAAAARFVDKHKGWIYQQCKGLRRNRFKDPVRYEYKIVKI